MFNWFFGGFSNVVTNFVNPIFSPIVAPIVQAIVPVLLPALEPLVKLVTTLVRPFEPILTPVISALSKGFAPIMDPALDSLVSNMRQSTDARWDQREKIEQQQKDNGTFDHSKYDRFDSVVPEAQQVQQQTVHAATMNSAELTEVRDALVSARTGYFDYSELHARNIVDSRGYVTNEKALYDVAGQQTLLPLEGENWCDGEILWSKARFEVIRVLERVGSGRDAFEANVVLTQNKATGEYTIAIGGTDSLLDILSDLSLIYNGDTAGARAAIREAIDQLFREDIPAGATVNLSGHSLGGAEVLQQYHDTPERFEKVYVAQAVGLGGEDGTYYDKKVWDGRGDPNIIEIFGDDAGEDFNDMVTYWGHIDAGKLIDVGPVKNVGESAAFGPDIEFMDSHLLGNVWATLPGGENAVPPVTSMDQARDLLNDSSLTNAELALLAQSSDLIMRATDGSGGFQLAQNDIEIVRNVKAQATDGVDHFIFDENDLEWGGHVIQGFDASQDVVDIGDSGVWWHFQFGNNVMIQTTEGARITLRDVDGDFDMDTNVIKNPNDFEFWY